MPRVWPWVSRTVAWTVILAVVAALGAGVVVPRIAGATPYTVLTGSMEPTYPPGTLVVVRPAAVADLRVSDVVTFQLESGKPAVATHRVVATTTTLDGERRLVTRGDANGADDPEPVREVQLRGRVWYAVPWLGHANQVITGDRRQLVLMVTVGLLLSYAGYMFTSAARDRRRSRRGSSGTAAAATEGGPVP